jgi:diguanylate cyclase (GGDEF)-like protein/PAS domain S-box-containing protein
MELLVRPLGFRTPGFVLYPLILYVAFHFGLLSALVSSAVGLAYVPMGTLLLGRELAPESSDAWRLGLIVVGVPAAGATVGLLRDRLERLRRQEGAARAAATAERERTARIVDSITDGVVAIDREWRVTYANAVAEQLARRRRSELIGRDLRELLPGLETNVFYRHYEQALREQVPVHFEAPSNLVDAWLEVRAYPSGGGLTILFHDDTERHQLEEKLRGLSVLDELTGLYNRRGFFTLAEQHCKLAERNGRGALLVFVDLDELKQINDSLGHVAGDQAIVAVSDALRQTFRESDILGRLGGDEFAALVLETDLGVAPGLLHRLRVCLEEYNATSTLARPQSVSVGTAYFEPDEHSGIEELIALADREMYEEKRRKLQL